jgi:hypothetical protein
MTWRRWLLWYEQLPEAPEKLGVDWEGQAAVTSSSASTAVRRWLWAGWVVVHERISL